MDDHYSLRGWRCMARATISQLSLTLLCRSKRPPPAVLKIFFVLRRYHRYIFSICSFTSKAFSDILNTTLPLIGQVFQILGHMG